MDASLVQSEPASAPIPVRTTEIRLQPCKLMVLRNEDSQVQAARFVSRDEEPLVLSWSGLCGLLAPSRERQALVNLRMLQQGAFVGLTKQATGLLSNFIFLNQDRSNRVEWYLKRDPTFEQRLHVVYRVVGAQWESTVTEFST